MRHICLLGVLVVLATSACATSGAVPRPYPGQPRPTAADAAVVPGRGDATPLAPSAVAGAVVETAQNLLGTAYRAGGADPAGFDCSGFVQFVYASVGIGLPRSVRQQWEAGMPVEEGTLEAGDLVFFAIDGDEVSHVGIALEGDRFVHAPSARGVVRVERLSAGYWARRYAGARRVLPAATSGDDRPRPGARRFPG